MLLFDMYLWRFVLLYTTGDLTQASPVDLQNIFGNSHYIHL
jgi:hypothetical protein